MGITDTRLAVMPKLPRVNRGQSYVDPTYGHRVTRVTDAASEGRPAEVPPYTNRIFGVTKKWGTVFYTYVKGSGGGHRLYSATHPFLRIGDINWNGLFPDEPEMLNFGGTPETQAQMTWLTLDGRWMRYDFDAGGAPEELFRVDSPTGEVFGDTHTCPSLDGDTVACSWFVSQLEKRLAIISLKERRILWEMPFFTEPVQGYQRRTGTPIMSLDGERFVVPLPTSVGTRFFVCRLDASVKEGAVFERLLQAEKTYEHSCQAQLGGALLDVYVSRANGGYDAAGAPRSPAPTVAALALVASFEHSNTLDPLVSAYMPLFSGLPGVHLTGGAWQRPDRIVVSSFSPSNATYRYQGAPLAFGQQQIVAVDLNVAVATKGASGFNRVCWHNSATQASNAFGNDGYWAEPHPMQSPDGSVIIFGSDQNFCRAEAEWTRGIDTYAVEL